MKNYEKCIHTNIKSNGVISPSCGLLWILPLKMLRGCIFTTAGIRIECELGEKKSPTFPEVFCWDLELSFPMSSLGVSVLR